VNAQAYAYLHKYAGQDGLLMKAEGIAGPDSVAALKQLGSSQ
jgi:hypothetical protein